MCIILAMFLNFRPRTWSKCIIQGWYLTPQSEHGFTFMELMNSLLPEVMPLEKA